MRSTVNEKLAWIATLIRSNTGITKKLSLDDMADGVDEVYTAGIAKGREVGISEGKNIGRQEGKEEGILEGKLIGIDEGIESVPFRVHKIIVGNDLTSGTNTILSDNDFIKEHYADEGFILQVISLQNHTEVPAFGYFYSGNRAFFTAGSYTYYGATLCATSSSFVARTVTGPCTNPTYSGGAYVEPAGNVMFIANATNATLRAGDYLIILSVAEV